MSLSQKINLPIIQDALFQNPAIRARIARDYALPDSSINSTEFCAAVVDKFQQTPVLAPLEQEISQLRVFEAATRAIGSNSRSWARFLTSEPRLRQQLFDFDVEKSAIALASGHLTESSIKPLLRGITAASDAKAILAWINMLGILENYYARVTRMGRAVRTSAASKINEELSDAELMLCLVALLARPSDKVDIKIRDAYLGFRGNPKLPGMGYVLASEFFRNLGWSGFKPDRHVKRLFDYWRIRPTPEVERRANALSAIIGSHRKELMSFLRYSLLGMQVTPAACSLSFADNHIWLLGAYVERKNRETGRPYLIDVGE